MNRFHFERLRIFRLFGRRGILLLIFGALWMVIGSSVLLIEQPPRFSGSGPHIPVLGLLDGAAGGWIWLAAGFVAVFVGLTRTRYSGRDGAGFNALLAPPFLWLMGYGWSQLAWFATQEYGRSTAWVAMVVWAIMCAWVALSAGWPDPDDPAVRPREEK